MLTSSKGGKAPEEPNGTVGQWLAAPAKVVVPSCPGRKLVHWLAGGERGDPGNVPGIAEA